MGGMRRPAVVASLLVFVFGTLGVSAARAQSTSPSVPASSPSMSSPSSVIVAKVDGSIDGTVASYLSDRIDEAVASGSTLVIQLDSAGTLDGDPIALARRVLAARVPVVVWVGPAPAKARGAALLLMLASSLPAVAPGAGVGPLEPVDLIDARNAALHRAAALRETAASWAAARGRTPPTFPAAPVPAQAALDDHLADVAAASLPDLLDAIDGRTVRTSAGSATLHTRVAQAADEAPVDVRFTDLGPVARVLHATASPSAIYLLIVVGLAALAFELTQPGFGFAGFAGVATLALAAYGLAVVPFAWPGLVVLLAGVGLFVADVVRRSLGALTVLGLAAFLAGSLTAWRDVSPIIAISPWLAGALTVASGLYYGFALTVAIQSRDRVTSTQRGLVGLAGETRGELRPEGPVFVKGALWRGRSVDGPIPPGTRVRVRGVDGLILRVEPDPSADEPGDDDAP